MITFISAGFNDIYILKALTRVCAGLYVIASTSGTNSYPLFVFLKLPPIFKSLVFTLVYTARSLHAIP